ncbi:MAG: hypothetical protein ACRES2_07525 [Steroidobacteraceae bacterium]
MNTPQEAGHATALAGSAKTAAIPTDLAEASLARTAPAVLSAPGHPHSVSLPGAQATATPVLVRLQAHGNRALAESIYQLRRIGATTVAGVVAVVLAATLFIANNLPQGNAIAALKSQLLHLTPLLKGGTAVPLSASVLAALPSRAEAPEIVANILAEARASGVDLPRGEYEFVPARDGVAARYRMTFPVHATYPQLREFMDRTLVAMPAVAVEGMRIERKTVGDDGVEAELRFSAFVRSDP